MDLIDVEPRRNVRGIALCPDCPCFADCQAEGECIGHIEGALDSSPTLPEWDVIA